MARLITDHDPYHIHKIFGVFGLFHLIARALLLVFRGYAFCQIEQQEEKCSSQEIQLDLICVLLQGCLSWSSLLLPLPQKRNFTSPMIWPEFRLHSIVFATRHVIGTCLAILNLWPEQPLINFAAKLTLVMATSLSADWITQVHGDKEHRTTNAMPYPSDVTPEMQRGIKLNYSLAQFLATLGAVSEQPDFAFMPLYSIQIAALLMTLCRKGKISALTVHQTYIFFLCFPMFLPMIAELIKGRQANPEYVCLMVVLKTIHFFVSFFRIDHGFSKFATWAIILGVVNGITKTPDIWNPLVQLHQHPLGIALITYRGYARTMPILRRYAPIFTGVGARGYNLKWLAQRKASVKTWFQDQTTSYQQKWNARQKEKNL